MFSWFPLFRKAPQVLQDDLEKKDDPMSILNVSESNILVIAGRKNEQAVERFINRVLGKFDSGTVFRGPRLNFNKDAAHGDLKEVEFTPTDLDSYLLSQKVSLESFDRPPSILVYDRCSVAGNPSYKETIEKNKKLRLTTLTVVSDIMEIERNLLNKMDIIIMFKEKNKVRQKSMLRSIWERKYKKVVTFEKFNGCLLDNLGPMKASLISKEGMYAVKLAKDGVVVTRVCAFKS